MRLEILLPFGVFDAKDDVVRVVAETRAGSCGFLPKRLDCVAALVPGILIYQCESKPDVYVAIDEGVLVKEGQTLTISVRNAIGGTQLPQLRDAIAREFLRLDDNDKSVRAALARIETNFIRGLASYQRG